MAATAALWRSSARRGAVRLQRILTRSRSPRLPDLAPGDSRLFVVEKCGEILHRPGGQAAARPFLNISRLSSHLRRAGTALDGLRPELPQQRLFYVSYTNGRRQPGRPLPGLALHPNIANPTRTVIIKLHQPFANHKGGHLKFGPDGKLYIGLGDGGSEGDPT